MISDDLLTKILISLLKSAKDLGMPIRSNIELQKLTFLIVKEILPEFGIVIEDGDEIRFISYKYGPFSIEVAERIDTLLELGIAEKVNPRGKATNYILTEAGEKFFLKLLEQDPNWINIYNRIKEERRKWGILEVKALLRYIYYKEEYQHYLKESLVKKKEKLGLNNKEIEEAYRRKLKALWLNPKNLE